MSAEPTPHRIRLRGPWEVRPHAAEAPTGRMNVPGTLKDGGWAGLRGRVSFYRRFGRPSNLGPADSVRLVFEGMTGPTEVWLNGERLGPIEWSASIDVTARLIERNVLEAIVDAADDSCGIVGEVVLEIRVM